MKKKGCIICGRKQPKEKRMKQYEGVIKWLENKRMVGKVTIS